MTYLVEDITEQDWDRVISSTGDTADKRRRFEYWRTRQLPGYPIRFALDSASGSFLFRAPEFPQEQENAYWFFFEGVLYSVSVGTLDHHVQISPLGQRSLEELSLELESAISDALSVYGRFGFGPNGRDGKMPGFHKVVPTFGRR